MKRRPWSVFSGFVTVALLLCVGALMASPVLAQKPGGVLEFWNRTDPPGFDLHRWTSHTPFFAHPVFSTLVRYDASKKEFLAENIIGDLAERWEVSPDGKTYTFFLHKNVQWHDGQPFTAADVAYSFEKMLDPKRSVIAGRFPGFGRLEVVDDHTVTVHMEAPQASFLPILAQGYAVMQPKHKADADGKKVDFLKVGTGPFMFKESVPGVSYTYVKNPHYFKSGLPYLDGLKIYIIRDRPAQRAAFVAHRVNMTNPSIGMPTQSIYNQHQKRAPDGTYSIQDFQMVRLMWFNLKEDKPWNDVRVRRAINLALDREQLVIAGVGDLEWGRIGGVFPPGSPYALPPEEMAQLHWWNRPYEERLAEAKRLMKEAGYENGFQLRLVARTIPLYKRILSQAADQMRQINIDVSLDLPETAQAMGMREKGDFDMYFEVMYANIGDPDEIRGYHVTGGPENWTGYSNSKLDELFTKQSQATDMAERQQYAHEIERILAQDAPVIPTFFIRYGVGQHPEVKNWTPPNTPYSAHLQLEQVWLDK
jgi:peptide/nickel transport system substrate-binding protein